MKRVVAGSRNGRMLERIVIAYTGKWRDLRYGTGSVSDLSIDQKAF
jgi:hypothetical protein